ncbi:MAG: hypothetical protein WC683_09925 [bacterium]
MLTGLKALVASWIGGDAGKWWHEQELDAYPLFKPCDVGFSRYHGTIGTLIAFFSGRGWSHQFTCLGAGEIAEAVSPKGRITGLYVYMDRKHSIEVWRFPDNVVTPHYKSLLVGHARGVVGRPYDYTNIARHLVDSVCNFLFGMRPLAQYVKDADGAGKNVCSEWWGWVWFFVTGLPFNPGPRSSKLPHVKQGQETPAQNYGRTIEMGAVKVFEMRRGKIVYIAEDF